MTKIFLFVLLLIPLLNSAQTIESYSSWNTLMLDYHINDKIYIKNEAHFRRTNFLKDWQQILIRPSVNYRLNETVELSAGYSFAKNFTAVYNFHENNVWEQVTLTHSASKSKFKHRFRYEQRFIEQITPNPEEGFIHGNDKFLMRWRYRFTWSVPLLKITETNTLGFTAFDEIWINTQKGVVPKSLNQNWFYVGVNFPIFINTALGMGYMSAYAPHGNDTYTDNNIWQTTLTYHIK